MRDGEPAAPRGLCGGSEETSARQPSGFHALWPTVAATVLDADVPGPTAIVQAGIHGDGIAGAHALQELLEEASARRAGGSWSCR